MDAAELQKRGDAIPHWFYQMDLDHNIPLSFTPDHSFRELVETKRKSSSARSKPNDIVAAKLRRTESTSQHSSQSELIGWMTIGRAVRIRVAAYFR